MMPRISSGSLCPHMSFFLRQQAISRRDESDVDRSRGIIGAELSELIGAAEMTSSE
jgi:hypothetical protein